MCGRYYIAADDLDDELAAYMEQAQQRADGMQLSMVASGEIRPTNIAPVIATTALRREIGAFPMQWGFTHPKHNVLVFNTRSETAAEKPLFCTSIHDRRCLIPASCYYEWQKNTDKKKTKYSFSQESGEPLYLAGLYLRSSQHALPCFTILTRDATDAIKGIHGRMPVILPSSSMYDWLSPGKSYSELLLKAVDNVTFQPTQQRKSEIAHP